MIGSLRGVMSGEGVEGSHVENISFILGSSKLGVAESGGVRRLVGPVWIGEKAHWRRRTGAGGAMRRRRKKRGEERNV
jgi:hypothetical protein